VKRLQARFTTRSSYVVLLLAAVAAGTMGGCTSKWNTQKARGVVSVEYREGGDITIRSGSLVIQFDSHQTLSASLVFDNRQVRLTHKTQSTRFEPSDYVTVAGRDIRDFVIDYRQIFLQDVATPLGNGKRVEIPSHTTDGNWSIKKVVSIDLYSAFPQSAILSATYQNIGVTPFEVQRIVQVAQTIDSSASEQRDLWTFQGASLGWGRDFIFALPRSFQADNPIGQMMPDGSGGGIPVNDFWYAQSGIAIGHVEPETVACWMPVSTVSGAGWQIRLETRPAQMLAPRAMLATPRAFITVHRGDFYEPLRTYRAMLRAQGVSFLRASENLYNPVWWTYAFGHNFRPGEVYSAIPKFKELGIQWIIINNRWWDHYGDWRPRTDKFGSEAGFKQMLGRLHQEGLKCLIWWLPYGVQVKEYARSGLYNDPEGCPKQSPEIEKMISASADVALRHRDWLILDEKGTVVPVTRKLAALCPAYQPARDYMAQLARYMIQDWKVDGFYMDAVYTVPPCYNPVHHHASPYDSVRQLANLFRDFRRVIEQYDPQGMLMLCSCGTTMNHCLLPTTNEPVTADPVGSEQIRWRVKMYKALMGPSAPVFADRVESSQFTRVYSTEAETGRDFASCMGTGGVLGTIFIWPKIDKRPGDLEYRGELEVMKQLLLTQEKDSLWKKWFGLYRQKMLSSGEFLDLYTVGFDMPEGYAIRKDGRLYYAFFVSNPRPWGLVAPPDLPESKDRSWEGRIELRGLEKSRNYRIVDYENGKSFGRVDGSQPYLEAKFTNHLILEATPVP
jgi:alpha-galactosidase